MREGEELKAPRHASAAATRDHITTCDIVPTADDPRFEYKRRIWTKANIWSLACIWLKFATWYLQGEMGREEFAYSRSEEKTGILTGIFTDDYFRVLGNRQAAMVKPGVIE